MSSRVVSGPAGLSMGMTATGQRSRRERMLLQGKKLLITGVLTPQSIAFGIAEAAQKEGAELVLTSFGRAMSLTERSARRLDPAPEVLELDVANPAHFTALTESLKKKWGKQAPMGGTAKDERCFEAVARSAVAMLSDFFPYTTGEMVHVDGGYHAVGAAPIDVAKEAAEEAAAAAASKK